MMDSSELKALLRKAYDHGIIDAYEIEGDIVHLELQGVSIALRIKYAESLIRNMIANPPPPRNRWSA